MGRMTDVYPGVTGTGKTHTMRGGKSLAERGIIPRLLSAIYRRSRKFEKDSGGQSQVQVMMSYYEIYNDKVFDLFEPPEKRTPSGLPLRDNGGKTVVVGLTERPCESLKEFEKLYDHANVNRSTSATKLNAHSSRSHAILCVRVVTRSGDSLRSSTVSAIDLAGSEDNRRTDNNRERLVESSCINRSLFVLAQCVEAISKKHSRVPYRESKMTRILSLGQNNGLTIMFLNLAPLRSYHLDTISSLNFANRTKKIEVREVENEPVTKGYTKPAPFVPGPSMQRQPLRPLAETAHNIPVRPSELDAKTATKRSKAFAVYADKIRSSLEANRPHAQKRSSPLKRPSDSLNTHQPRRLKIPRVNDPGVSKAAIEDMVEKKVAEILASRTAAEPAPLPTGLSEEVKSRLERLEQRVEDQGEGKSEGLTFLLMARQHQAHGEDSSALKCYKLAQEYFPENTKLAGKIAKLQRRMSGAKKQALGAPAQPLSNALHPGRTASTAAQQDADYEQDSFAPADEDDSDFDTPARSRARAKRPRTVRVLCTDDEPPMESTPRTRRLLHIINSRDASQIRLLRGVGAKKAEAIVAALCAGGRENEESGAAGDVVEVESLGQLSRLRGVGAKTVDNMRCGLQVGVQG